MTTFKSIAHKNENALMILDALNLAFKLEA